MIGVYIFVRVEDYVKTILYKLI